MQEKMKNDEITALRDTSRLRLRSHLRIRSPVCVLLFTKLAIDVASSSDGSLSNYIS